MANSTEDVADENRGTYFSPAFTPAVDYEATELEFMDVQNRNSHIEFSVSKRELYITASFLVCGVLIMGLVIALIEVVRLRPDAQHRTDSVHGVLRSIFLPLVLFCWISASSFTVLYIVPIIQKVGISSDRYLGYRRIDGRAPQSVVFTTVVGIVVILILSIGAFYGGYEGQSLACLDSKDELPPESARSCLIATKTYLVISLILVLIIIAALLTYKRFHDQVDAFLRESLEERGTSLEMVGDL